MPPAPRPLILVAEDEDELRCLISTRLSHAGLCVRELEDGLELGDYLSLARESGGRVPMPNLILTDERMPGARGLEVVRKLRTQELDLPVLVLTAYPDDRVYGEALQLGDTRIVAKPIDLDTLADLVWLRLWSVVAQERSLAAKTHQN